MVDIGSVENAEHKDAKENMDVGEKEERANQILDKKFLNPRRDGGRFRTSHDWWAPAISGLSPRTAVPVGPVPRNDHLLNSNYHLVSSTETSFWASDTAVTDMMY